jgi:hypothetical protein
MPIEATQALVLALVLPPLAPLPPPPLLPHAATARAPSAVAAITTVPFMERPSISMRNFTPKIFTAAELLPGVIPQESQTPGRPKVR